jgi:general secretion pathway protein B
MSYILDALKKAERERGIARVPTLATMHEMRTVRQSRTWIIAGGLAITAAAAIWFFLPSLGLKTQPASPSRSSSESSSDAAVSRDASGRTSGSADTAPSEEAATEAEAIARQTEALPSESGPTSYEPPMRKSPDSGRRTNPPDQNAALSQKDRQASASSDKLSLQIQPGTVFGDAGMKAAAAKEGPAQTKPIPLREAADKMTISILMYAETKAERMVFIDGRKYVEGDYVGGHYLLESITQDGVILSYEGDQLLLRPGPK